MITKHLCASLLITLALWSASANAGRFSQTSNRSLSFWSFGVAGIVAIPVFLSVPLYWFWLKESAGNKKVTNDFSLELEHIRLFLATEKMVAALTAESHSMLVLVSDIDETMRYSGALPIQTEHHFLLNDFFESLRSKNKLMLIYNTNRPCPVREWDFLSDKPEVNNQNIKMLHASLNTLPRPDIMIYAGGEKVCYLSEAVEYMRSRSAVDILKGGGCEKYFPDHIFPEFWDHWLINSVVRNSIDREGLLPGWNYEWGRGSSEYVSTFQPETIAEAGPYLLKKLKIGLNFSNLANNLPECSIVSDLPPETLSSEQLEQFKELEKMRAKIASYDEFRRHNYGYYFSRPDYFSCRQTDKPFKEGENFALFYDRTLNKGAALSRVIGSLSENQHFKGKKIYLVTAGDSIFDVSMLSPTLRYPFLRESTRSDGFKPLPANVNFIKAILTQAKTKREKRQINVLIDDFPELKKHVVRSPAPDVLSFIETLADVLAHEVDSQPEPE